MFTLAHLSDLHIGPLPAASLAQLSSKRFLGWLSWKRRRQGIHRREVLDALAQDLVAQAPDHVAVTGDLTNIALPAEFRQAAEWLATLGTADWISVVPGNHDAYVGLPWEDGLSLWSDYMAPDAAEASGAEVFPYLRRRGPLAVVGLSTAVPTLPGSAAGALGPAQIERLAELLKQLGQEGCFRCLLLHHPPLDEGFSPRKRLRDAAAFREVLAGKGAELVLHGHDHRFNDGRIAGPQGAIPVIGVPSASALPDRHRPGAHYHLYRILRDAAGWRIELRVRGPAAGSTALSEAPARTLEVPA